VVWNQTHQGNIYPGIRREVARTAARSLYSRNNANVLAFSFVPGEWTCKPGNLPDGAKYTHELNEASKLQGKAHTKNKVIDAHVAVHILDESTKTCPEIYKMMERLAHSHNDNVHKCNDEFLDRLPLIMMEAKLLQMEC
jgi:hypothetical protein